MNFHLNVGFNIKTKNTCHEKYLKLLIQAQLNVYSKDVLRQILYS